MPGSAQWGVPNGKPPIPLSPLSPSKGEELFAAKDAVESTRFLRMLGRVLSSPPGGLETCSCQERRI